MIRPWYGPVGRSRFVGVSTRRRIYYFGWDEMFGWVRGISRSEDGVWWH